MQNEIESFIKFTLRVCKLAWEQGLKPPTYEWDGEDHTIEYIKKNKAIIFWVEESVPQMLIMTDCYRKSRIKENPTDAEIALELSFIHDKERSKTDI